MKGDRQLRGDGCRRFVFFAALSGVGWLLDVVSYAMLVEVLGGKPFVSNFISSYVGVTFVWFASLKRVFGRNGAGGRLLVAYWGFQLLSILGYSHTLQLLVGAVVSLNLLTQFGGSGEMAAKLLITPFNLVTNFLFMKFLTRFMQQISIFRA